LRREEELEEREVARDSFISRESSELGPSWPITCERYLEDLARQKEEEGGSSQLRVIVFMSFEGMIEHIF
tara:strand:+ start:1303 stop:1512 length:210 start_codon:yes stop_codon:yes gene_type:complete